MTRLYLLVIAGIWNGMSIIKNWIFNFEEKNEKNKPFSLFLLLMEFCKNIKKQG